MPKQNIEVKILDEIIDNASVLPLELQDCLLAVAKGMAFTASLYKQQKLAEQGKEKS